MKEIKVTVPDGKNAEWKNINGVQTLVLVDEKDDRPITERIKTFEDACKELNRLAEEGNENMALLLADYESNADNIKTEATLAYMKLCIIVAALNEGWEPKFTEDELRWYPWHWLYTQKEIDNMRKEERKKCAMMSTDDYVTEYAGFAFALSYYSPAYTYAIFGSRLCSKSNELASYCGTQFIELWADFKLLRK